MRFRMRPIALATCVIAVIGACAGEDALTATDDADERPAVTVAGRDEPRGPALAADVGHVCALREGGTVACRGENYFGELGNGTNIDSASPVPVSQISDAVAVTAARQYACALRRDSSVACWGRNDGGRLGDGSNRDSNVPVTVSGVDDAVAVSAGSNHACAVHRSGSVSCWGSNTRGQLGSGTDEAHSDVPVTVAGISDAIAVTAAAEHSCAVRDGGTIVCWGENYFGELGNGTTTEGDTTVPVGVSGITDATAVAASLDHSCAVLEAGTVRCWGRNERGRLGDGTTEDSSVPVTVSGITDAVSVSAGAAYSCALLRDGTVSCWGQQVGQRRDDLNFESSNVPVPVAGISGATELSSSDSYSCALLESDSIACWGGHIGPLNRSTFLDSSVPVTVPGFR